MEMRKDVRDFDTECIASILEESKPVRKDNKQVYQGKKLILSMSNGQGSSVHECRGIVKIVINFDKQLYSRGPEQLSESEIAST